MRLGINDHLGHQNPEEWISLIQKYRLRAAVAPMTKDEPEEVRREYLRLARENDIVIGEVGIWRNVVDRDEKRRKANIEYAKEQLAFAEEIGACCCVNTGGSAGEIWDGYYPENYSAEIYTCIVDTVREIIDAVKPKRTYFTLEPMYWMHPDSPEDYLKMLQDIDRDRFAVHMDYANMITSFEKYHHCGAFLDRCFGLLGPYIKSVHAKDVILNPIPPVCINETLPGTGHIDFRQVFALVNKLDQDLPVFVEHLPDRKAYESAIAYLQKVWDGK